MPSGSARYAVPAVLVLALCLALTVGVGRGAGRAAPLALASTAQALAFAVAWTLAEPLRGGWGLQFPWNPVALGLGGRATPTLQVRGLRSAPTASACSPWPRPA